MDDVTIGGDIAIVAKNVETVSSLGIAVRLDLNATKCELIYSDSLLEKVLNPSFPYCRHMFCSSEGSSPTPDLENDLVIWQFPVVDPTKASLLGSPLGAGTGMDRILTKRCTELERMLDRLGLLASQDALLSSERRSAALSF